jgi:phosphoglycolate phosphatase-like HAD superfamily hydrolase
VNEVRKSKNLWNDLAKEISDQLKKPELEKEIEQVIRAFAEERIVRCYSFQRSEDEKIETTEKED